MPMPAPTLPLTTDYIYKELETDTYPLEEFYHLKNDFVVVEELLTLCLSDVQSVACKKLMSAFCWMYNPNWLGTNWTQQESMVLGYIFHKAICEHPEINWKKLEYIPSKVQEYITVIDFCEFGQQHHLSSYSDGFEALFAIQRLLRSPSYTNALFEDGTISKVQDMGGFKSDNYLLEFDWLSPTIQNGIMHAISWAFTEISRYPSRRSDTVRLMNYFREDFKRSWNEFSVETQLSCVVMDMYRTNSDFDFSTELPFLKEHYGNLLPPGFFDSLQLKLSLFEDLPLKLETLLEVYKSLTLTYSKDVIQIEF